jgi:glycosyltransferase involved in cell wall biosynthesis
MRMAEAEKNRLRNYFRGRRFLIMIGRLDVMGWAERQALLLADFLQSDIGAEVTFLTSKDGKLLGDRLRRKGISYYVCPVLTATTRKKALEMMARLYVLMRREIKPDLMIPFVARNSKIMAHMYRLIGARYTLWNQRDEGLGLYGSSTERRALRWVEDIVSNSWTGKDFLCDNYDVSAQEVYVVNNGIRVPDPKSIDPYWRDQLCLSDDCLVVAMVANMTSHKDHPTLISAWKSVVEWDRSNDSRVRLILAGKQSALGVKLKAQIFDEGLGDSVVFVGHTEKVEQLTKESDLIVHSSFTEGCPNAVLEAMAMGRAVVATDIPGTRQALGDEYANECLARPRDPDDLAARIINLLADDQLRDEIGQQNRARIRREFSVERMGYSYLNLIYKSLRRRGLANEAAEGALKKSSPLQADRT